LSNRRVVLKIQKRIQHFLRVTVRAYGDPPLAQNAVGVDQEGVTQRVGSHPRPVGLAHGSVGVGEQWKAQLLAVTEGCVVIDLMKLLVTIGDQSELKFGFAVSRGSRRCFWFLRAVIL
jgi:hypothetical protein